MAKNNIYFPKFYVLSKRNLVIISCEFAYKHRMSMLTTKLHEILLGSFRGVAITYCFSSTFNFDKIPSSKGHNFQKKISRNSRQIYTSTRHILNYYISTFIFRQNCKFKKANPPKIFACMTLSITKFHEIVQFQQYI